MKHLVAALAAIGVLGMAPAFAGEWRVDSARCADLREDRRDARESRRDERYDYSRADRREDRYDRKESRRDRALTVCPRSAFYYAPSRGEFYNRNYRAPRLSFAYDRDHRLHYRVVGGRRIYVRG